MHHHFNTELNRLEIVAADGHIVAFVEAAGLWAYPYFERLSNESIF